MNSKQWRSSHVTKTTDERKLRWRVFMLIVWRHRTVCDPLDRNINTRFSAKISTGAPRTGAVSKSSWFKHSQTLLDVFLFIIPVCCVSCDLTFDLREQALKKRLALVQDSLNTALSDSSSSRRDNGDQIARLTQAHRWTPPALLSTLLDPVSPCVVLAVEL